MMAAAVVDTAAAAVVITAAAAAVEVPTAAVAAMTAADVAPTVVGAAELLLRAELNRVVMWFAAPPILWGTPCSVLGRCQYKTAMTK